MRIDVRLSLGTTDRVEARNRGAALTAAMPKVTTVLRRNVEANPNITEAELRRIAAAMYEEKLQEVCDDQRSTAMLGELHSIANLAYIDFFQRMTELGGRMSFLPSEKKAKEDAGWDQQRVEDLKAVIQKDEVKGLSPLRKEDIVRHLKSGGFASSATNQWRLEVMLYPFYRDVFVDAQVALEDLVDPVGKTDPFNLGPDEKTVSEKSANSSENPTRNVPTTAEIVEDEWSNLSPLEVADKMIASNSLPLEHRVGGKRARPQTDEQTERQIRWAATLLQKSLPTGRPLCLITQDDLKTFDCHLEHISVHYGKSPADREITDTLDDAAARAAKKLELGTLDEESIGLHLRTSNRHFERLKQLYEFIPASYRTGGTVDFPCFIAPVDEDEFDARDRLSLEQGEAIFRLPPWTGCESVEKKGRLRSGKAILHDGLFFVLLLVWYTGARREEICKLMLDDVQFRNGIFYLAIRPTITGRVKNKSARRVVVICDELIRLGFLRYVEAMREAGETLLFPELMPASSTKRKLGDVFYKIWWVHIALHVPDLKRGQAMHSARHMVSDELKDQEVFIEFRNDHLGHKGKGGEGVTRYPSRTSFTQLKKLVEQIPVVTSHIPDQNAITLLPDRLRTPRPSRKQNKAS